MSDTVNVVLQIDKEEEEILTERLMQYKNPSLRITLSESHGISRQRRDSRPIQEPGTRSSVSMFLLILSLHYDIIPEFLGIVTTIMMTYYECRTVPNSHLRNVYNWVH